MGGGGRWTHGTHHVGWDTWESLWDSLSSPMWDSGTGWTHGLSYVSEG